MDSRPWGIRLLADPYCSCDTAPQRWKIDASTTTKPGLARHSCRSPPTVGRRCVHQLLRGPHDHCSARFAAIQQKKITRQCLIVNSGIHNGCASNGCSSAHEMQDPDKLTYVGIKFHL